MIGADPLLVDPENGDYSLVPNSPAEGYGCQIFTSNSRINLPSQKQVNNHFLDNTVRNSIEVGGNITSNEFWSADTVKVIGDVTIENGVTVSIDADVKVEFQDFYSIDVKGTILALGESGNLITFTSSNPELFQIDYSESGAWKGIKFNNISTLNNTSKLEYCIFENSKSFVEKGGAIQIVNVSELEITNCIFRNNIADYGGAISFEYHSAPKIFGNLFHSNQAFISGSPIYCSYSYPRITNNTIVSNFVLNEELFHETAAIHTYISKPQLANNIIWNNVTNFYDPHQVLHCKAFYTTYNDIQFGHDGKGNISADPHFLETGEYPFALDNGSPCIDSGTSFLPFGLDFPEFDLAGNLRTYNDSIDMGAYEWSGVSVGNYELEIMNYELSNYPNPFNPSTTITFKSNTEITLDTEVVIYNLKGQKVKSIPVILSGDEGQTGKPSVTWNGTDQNNKHVSSGIYFANLKVGKQLLTRKMMLIK